VNDLGFLLQADSRAGTPGLRFSPGTQLVLSYGVLELQLGGNSGARRDARGRAATQTARQLNNLWWVHSGVTAGQLGTTFCDRDCTRGGPAVRGIRIYRFSLRWT